MWTLKRLISFTALTLGLAIFAPQDALAADPLDDLDGTEGWDQVVQPPAQRQQRDVRAEREAFRREVADWESVRQLWQREREGYIAEKTNHRRMSKQLRRQRRPSSGGQANQQADSLYEDDWGDQPGQGMFESTSNIDRAIDSELGDTGSSGEANLDPEENFQQPIYTPIPKVDPEEERLRKLADEEARRKRDSEARRQLEEMERKRKAEEERRRREEEERKRKEAEAAAGAAAAAELLKQQEEMIKKEQEAIRKKAKLDVDQEGQVVDPELKKEIDDEDKEEED